MPVRGGKTRSLTQSRVERSVNFVLEGVEKASLSSNFFLAGKFSQNSRLPFAWKLRICQLFFPSLTKFRALGQGPNPNPKYNYGVHIENTLQ
jgi:hypothetical protein